MPLYRELRTESRNGQWRKVIEDLRELAANVHSNSQATTEIAYLERHGEMGRMNYTIVSRSSASLAAAERLKAVFGESSTCE